MKARTKEEFIKIVREQVAAMAVTTDLQIRQVYSLGGRERFRWISPLATSGRSAVLHVTFGEWKYRFHANTDRYAMLDFLKDAETHDIVALNETKSTGDRCDTDNHFKVRTGLYIYRQPA